MQVKELIEKLAKLDQEAEVFCHWDGALRSPVDYVFEAKESGLVGLYQSGENVNEDEDRPKDAPSVEEDECWGYKREDWERLC